LKGQLLGKNDLAERLRINYYLDGRYQTNFLHVLEKEMSLASVFLVFILLAGVAVLVKPMRETWSQHRRIAKGYKDSHRSE